MTYRIYQIKKLYISLIGTTGALNFFIVTFSLFAMHTVMAQSMQLQGLTTVYTAQNLPVGPYDPTTLLVKFKTPDLSKLRDNPTNTGISSITSKLKNYPVTGFSQIAVHGKHSRTNTSLFQWYEVSLSKKVPYTAIKENGKTVYPELEKLQSNLESDSTVQEVSKNYLITPDLVPNDPYYSSSGSFGQSYPDLWGIKDINAAGAWDMTTGSSSTVIAVVDTGVDITQPDIAANIWTNPNPGSDGYPDDIHGWNWCDDNNDVMDDNGHGTHVAGTIGAVGNNALGVVGVNWHVKIMPLKFLCADGYGYTAEAALALEYAADNGAKVSNNSWDEATADDPVINDAIAYEVSKGVVPVAAAGNNYGGNALDYDPAGADGAITVGAVDNTNTIANFSNTGERIDVVAPGVNILSLKSSEASTVCTGSEVVNTNYCVISGTSMATPHVSGVIGLMLSENPNLTVEQVRQILRTTATPLGPPGNFTYGSGLVNAQAAVAASQNPTVLTPIITSPSSRATLGGTVSFTGSANGATFASYTLQAGQGRTPSAWVTIASSSTPITNGTLATLDTTTLPDNSYTFKLTATDTNGKTYYYSIYDVVVHNMDAVITTPLNIMPKTATVPIDGEADVLSGLEFNYYTIDYGIGASPSSWSTTGVTLANNGVQAETATTDNLGSINTSSLANNTEVQIRLTVYDTGGGSKTFIQTVYVDQDLLPGWPIYIPGANTQGSATIGGGETFADLEGNSQQDVIIPSFTNKIYAFRKDGTPVPGWPITVQSGDDFNSPPIVDDLDGSLLPDIIIEASISGTPEKRLYIFKSDGTPYPGWTPLVVDGQNPLINEIDDPMPSVADLNNDGQKELILDTYTYGNTSSTLHAYKLDGTELAGWPKTISYTPWVAMPPTIASIDGSGYPDIILASKNQVYVYDHTGNLLSGWPVTLPDYNATEMYVMGQPGVGDLQGNGKEEVVIEGQEFGSLGGGVDAVAYAYNANGSLLPGWPYVGDTVTYFGDSDLETPAIADVTGDGKDDVIFTGYGGGYIEDGVGRVATTVNYGWGTPEPSLAEFSNNGTVYTPGVMSGDVNGGIAWSNATSFVPYWTDSNFTSENPVSVSETSDVSPMVSADIDGSGQEAFAAGMIHQNELYAYLWQLPGPTHPVDSWPMLGHDPQHTNHYDVGQATSDTTPPQIVISAPSNSATVSGTTTFSATAIDNVAVSKVEFYVDGKLQTTDTTWPYTTTFNASNLSNGVHTLTAKAYDTSNNETTSAPVSVTVTASNLASCQTLLYRLRSTRTGDHLYTTNISELVTAVDTDGYVPEGITGFIDSTNQTGDTALYRLREVSTGYHFYTTSQTEQSALLESGMYVSEGITGYISTSSGTNQSALYRLNEKSNGQHFYTTNQNEVTAAEASGYTSEGIIGYVTNSNPTSCHVPLYRLRSTITGDHLYTTNISELVTATGSDGYVPEGITGYLDSSDKSGDTALYRLREVATGFHFYTASTAEETALVSSKTFVSEGISGYVGTAAGSGLTPLFRLYSPKTGQHFYTASSSEETGLIEPPENYESEMNAGYVYTGY